MAERVLYFTFLKYFKAMSKFTLKLLIGILIYFLAVGFAIYAIPKLLSYALNSDYPMASIASGSMWPVLKRGDLVFIEGVKGKGDVNVGDIVVYKSGKGFIIHRVIGKSGEAVITKGDANSVADNPVKYEQVVGKALSYNGKPIRFPYLGSLSLMMKE
jgi:signal peptidase I